MKNNKNIKTSEEKWKLRVIKFALQVKNKEIIN